jgi:hypothetical protein
MRSERTPRCSARRCCAGKTRYVKPCQRGNAARCALPMGGPGKAHLRCCVYLNWPG